MNTSSMPPENEREDQDLAALLRAAGPRDQASATAQARVRAAVAAEWRATVAERQRRRRFVPLLAVASVATVAIAAWLAQPLLRQDAGPLATVALVTGEVQVRHGGSGRWAMLETAATIRAGDDVRTASYGRVALRLPDGLEVRLDTDTRLALAGAGAARLRKGAVYVDSGADARTSDATFILTTTAGDVRHLGTQYAVRTTGGTVQVSVREGSVAIERGHERLVGNAGEQLSLTAQGNVVRSSIAPRDVQWAWVAAITPAFEIEGRALDEFLMWAARETGRKLVYTSPAAAAAAASIKLKGSVAGLGPDAAVAAVFATTPSLQAAVGDSQLRVEHTAN